MKIKTIVESGPLNFDRRVNEAFEDDWHLAKRETFHDSVGGITFYAELVKVDKPATPDPLEALRVVRDFCEGTPTEKCLGACPLTPWCAMYSSEDGMSPAYWVIPEEVEA